MKKHGGSTSEVEDRKIMETFFKAFCSERDTIPLEPP